MHGKWEDAPQREHGGLLRGTGVQSHVDAGLGAAAPSGAAAGADAVPPPLAGRGRGAGASSPGAASWSPTPGPRAPSRRRSHCLRRESSPRSPVRGSPGGGSGSCSQAPARLRQDKPVSLSGRPQLRAGGGQEAGRSPIPPPLLRVGGSPGGDGWAGAQLRAQGSKGRVNHLCRQPGATLGSRPASPPPVFPPLPRALAPGHGPLPVTSGQVLQRSPSSARPELTEGLCRNPVCDAEQVRLPVWAGDASGPGVPGQVRVGTGTPPGEPELAPFPGTALQLWARAARSGGRGGGEVVQLDPGVETGQLQPETHSSPLSGRRA